MLILKIKGGLGNQLFQYAFGRLLAVRRPEPLKLDLTAISAPEETVRVCGLGHFNIKAEEATPAEIEKAARPYGILSDLSAKFSRKVLRRFHIGYEEGLLSSKSGYFQGFFQSHRYLEPIRAELLEEITLKEPLSEAAAAIAASIDAEAVSVHIRRGDYASPKYRDEFLVCDVDYYQRALGLIKEKFPNARLFVFSDDIAWAKENLPLDGAVFVSGQGIPDYEELVLMSLCHRHIIPNSTFAFWGAWLDKDEQKTVIAPKAWNKRYGEHYKEMLPEAWIRI